MSSDVLITFLGMPASLAAISQEYAETIAAPQCLNELVVFSELFCCANARETLTVSKTVMSKRSIINLCNDELKSRQSILYNLRIVFFDEGVLSAKLSACSLDRKRCVRPMVSRFLLM